MLSKIYISLSTLAMDKYGHICPVYFKKETLVLKVLCKTTFLYFFVSRLIFGTIIAQILLCIINF